MASSRTARFSLLCVGLWCAQVLLMAIALRRAGSSGAFAHRYWEWSAWAATAALGGMLFAQVCKALRWRLRRSRRASPEVLAERRRIARDLHDRLGAPLVFAQSLTDPTNPNEHELRMALEKCLLSARLIVDDMDASEAPFIDRLAQLRYRIAPVLERRGIHLVWDVALLDGPAQPAAHSTPHLMAIIEESLSNALQHARATEIRVRVQLNDVANQLLIEIADNGSGIETRSPAAPQPARGKGLAGLGRRAQLAGAQLDVGTGPDGGTCVRLVVDCQPASAAAPVT